MVIGNLCVFWMDSSFDSLGGGGGWRGNTTVIRGLYVDPVMGVLCTTVLSTHSMASICDGKLKREGYVADVLEKKENVNL